jgi:hypothetical protein
VSGHSSSEWEDPEVAPRSKEFTATVASAGRGRVSIPVPFDPDRAWGDKTHHHVAGTIAGRDFRGVVDRHGDGHGVTLGAAWCGDRDVAPGSVVAVVMHPEGIQRADLAPDIADALDADPEAGAFFDSLAQFYRTAYVKWIEATKRSPVRRAERIAEMIRLLREGHKERPRN